MADEPLSHEEFADAHNAEMSNEIAELNQKIIDLEEENDKAVRENKEYKKRIEELKASVEKLSSENEDLRNQLSSAQSENKAFGSVAARAAELEGEVSRLHHDLASAMSDLKDSNTELSDLKKELEVAKGREKGKEVKLEAAEREKALLVVELDARDKQIQVFKKNVEELEAVAAGKRKSSDVEKNEFEVKVEKMKAEISVLQSCLDEKEKVIRKLEAGSVSRGINGDALVDGGRKGTFGGLRQRELMFMGGTAIATAAVMGCYIHATRKH